VYPGLPRVKRAWFQHLNLKCDGPLSNFAFNFNLRRYNEAQVAAVRTAEFTAQIAKLHADAGAANAAVTDAEETMARAVQILEAAQVGTSKTCSPRHPSLSAPCLPRYPPHSVEVLARSYTG
jgi:hypothetical protein